MTGPEHYAEAERLIALIDSEQNAIPEQRVALAALAQVHATLAQTAAVVEAIGNSLGSSLLRPLPDPDVPWPGGQDRPSPWGQVLL